MLAHTQEVPTISDDKLFDTSAYVEFMSNCKEVLNKKEPEHYHGITMELVRLKRRVETTLSQDFWATLKSLIQNTDNLIKLNENVSTILKVWNFYILPLADTDLKLSINNLMFHTFNQDTPLKIKVFCDILLNKEYSFQGYAPSDLFEGQQPCSITEYIFKNHEHEANLKLMLSDKSRQLTDKVLFNLIDTYSFPAQKSWLTLTPSNKANLILNVSLMFKITKPEIERSSVLTNYLSLLTEYNDFNKFIKLNNAFDIMDKDVIESIFSVNDQDLTIPLPDIQ